MTDPLGEFIPRCKTCWIEVVPVREASKTWGKGETAPWKHRSLHDPQGNPACNRVALKDEDIEHVAPGTD